MNIKTKACVILLAVVPGLAAAAPPSTQIRDLSAATGLTERQVQMVVGAHTAYAEYLTSYDWARQRMIKVLGRQRYDDLVAGRAIQLDNGERVAFNDR
ncbi:MAG TPA: hypothetical protein VFF93_08065 [Luteimonas sp.]|jgi:hypothetical protein|nr:hypothetical protein [Luteimonas sp.]